MQKSIVHIIGTVLIVVSCLFFLAGQTIDFMLFKFQQNAIRKEIKQQIKSGVAENELHAFSASEIFSDDVKWIKARKEFKLNGQLFDVVKIQFSHGHFVYKCINDEQETKLFAELDKTIQKRLAEDPTNDDYYKNLVKDFVKTFIEDEKDTKIKIDVYKIIDSYSFSSSTEHLLRFSPPPQIIA